MIEKSVFTLGVQAGDKPADEATRPHYMELRKLFDRTMSGSYSDDVGEFAPVLRVDGSMWHWDRDGVDNVRVSKKTGHATADIFVPTTVWAAGDPQKIRSYLGGQVAVAYELISARMLSTRLKCDHERLRRDVSEVVKQFVG